MPQTNSKRRAGATALLLLPLTSLTSLTSLTPLAALAQDLTPSPPSPQALAACAEIGAPADRLVCYDKAMGRAPAPTVSAAEAANPGGGAPAPASTSQLAQKDSPTPVAAEREDTPSLLSKYWELEPEDKRGVFNFVGYKANYVLPLHWTNSINRTPHSPSQATVELPNYRHLEAKFQLSVRTKLAQDLLLPGADLWGAFTQQATWQIWNGTDSKPFRNTDYEPEMMYVVPTSAGLRALPFGWQWRYTQAGIAHQSNGQSDPLSRSWNRLNLAAGFERGDWSLIVRHQTRFNEPAATDNNPDLIRFRGHTEFQLNWAHEKQTAQLLYRTTLNGAKYGAVQFEWTAPVFPKQPNGLRWYFQAFSGYGETLTDYNFRQTSFGLGVSFLQF